MIDYKPLILIIDDEQSIRKFLRVALTSKEYSIVEAATGQEGLSAAVNRKPDVIILDLGLPDLDGVEVTRLLRQWTRIPIIILSVRGSEKDKISALDAGADDYLTKPFGVGELLARLRVALRHQPQYSDDSIFSSEGLKVNLVQRTVTVDNREVQLTPNEYDLLRLLVLNANKVITHHQLLREVWGKIYENEFHILHVNISNLRSKLEPNPARPRYIITEPGVGYRLRSNQK